jgi:hypothetical protein
MLLGVIGMSCVELLEAKIDQTKFLRMKSELGALKGIRDPAAHTHLKGTAISLDAPSVTLNRFSHIYEGLLDIDGQIPKHLFTFVSANCGFTQLPTPSLVVLILSIRLPAIQE